MVCKQYQDQLQKGQGKRESKSLTQQGLVCQQPADINFYCSLNAQLIEKKQRN